jgi:hypothetical protein
MKKAPVILLAIAWFAACQEAKSPELPQNTDKSSLSVPENFGDYWYQGKAELSSYDLEQVRYGSVHDGSAVLIFVTEPFSKSRQVKMDYGGSAEDKLTVLKLNKTKSFTTGLYPYQLMNSTFSPVEIGKYPHALKSATTVQEWCGHVYSQYNLREAGYQWKGFSYFGSEGDQEATLGKIWLEDGIWNQIRLNPESLPIGNFSMVPSSFYNRLKHKEVAGIQAKATLQTDGDLMQYTLSYPSINRKIIINFDAVFPFKIQSWEESYPEAGKIMTTKARLNKRVMKAYWNFNSPGDEVLREELGLEK